MPTYKLTEAAWLEYQAARAKGLLLAHLDPDLEYTVQEVLTLMADYGLTYSNPEYVGIGQQLIADGIIEQAGAQAAGAIELPPVIEGKFLKTKLVIPREVVDQVFAIADEVLKRAERAQQERWEKSLLGTVSKWASAIGTALSGKSWPWKR